MSSQSISPEERLCHLEGHYTDRVTAFRQRLAHLGLSRVLIVLLDIGKNVHWATASLASGLELVEPHRLPTTQTGLTQFIQMTDTLIARHTPLLVLLGHEPTGVYHEPWARALMDYYARNLAGQVSPLMEYTFFNPYQVKLARLQTHLRHRKTDPRDLAAMFDLMTRGLGQPAFLPTGVELLIRQEVGFIRAQSRLLGHLERQFCQQLDRLWPGAVVSLKQFRKAHPGLPLPTPIIETRPLQRDRLRVLLAHCPNPYDLRDLSDEDLLALYRQEVGRGGPALIHPSAPGPQTPSSYPPRSPHPWPNNSSASSSSTSSPKPWSKRAAAASSRSSLTLRPAISPPSPACGRQAGLGEMDAAAYLATVGSIHRFHRAAEVWAFVGFDPISDGSGDRPERIGHLSKHGDSASRDSLFQMGYRVAQNYAPVSLTFLDAFDRGKCEIEATLHAAHRTHRICFHLMYYDEPFENRSTPQLEAEKAHRWRQFQAEKKRRGSRRTRGKRHELGLGRYGADHRRSPLHGGNRLWAGQRPLCPAGYHRDCLSRPGGELSLGGSVRTVLDMGGQDCKAIQCDSKGKVGNFLMNDKCAAGTGRGMEVFADLMNVRIEDVGLRSLEVDEEPEAVSSTCVVFARTEAVGLLRAGWPTEKVLAAYTSAMARESWIC